MPNRRNLTEREIVEAAEVDLSSLNLTRSGEAGAALEAPGDGGETGKGIGVPTNIVVISQEVDQTTGRVIVTVEFDGVAGAQQYEAMVQEVVG